MPLKLIALIVGIILVTIFAGFNAKNVCNVSIIFKEFKDVPVFVTSLVSFVLGIIASIPFFFGKNKKKESGNLYSSEQPLNQNIEL